MVSSSTSGSPSATGTLKVSLSYGGAVKLIESPPFVHSFRNLYFKRYNEVNLRSKAEFPE
jgi:hypothetical protein